MVITAVSLFVRWVESVGDGHSMKIADLQAIAFDEPLLSFAIQLVRKCDNDAACDTRILPPLSGLSGVGKFLAGARPSNDSADDRVSFIAVERRQLCTDETPARKPQSLAQHVGELLGGMAAFLRTLDRSDIEMEDGHALFPIASSCGRSAFQHASGSERLLVAPWRYRLALRGAQSKLQGFDLMCASTETPRIEGCATQGSSRDTGFVTGRLGDGASSPRTPQT